MACLLAWGISSAALRPLYPLDETRYASVAWTMYREGSWWPMLGSQLYTHKPPLLFWLMHVAWKIGGYSVPPLRVLTLVLTMACLWRSMTLSAALWGRRPGVLLVPALLAGNWYVSFMGVAL
jgi:4-amino-4-deoxy-L-arabinose transferase-like glycosyltransferase